MNRRAAHMSKQLFGGAIVAWLPEDWLDASDVRPVPDHQEVWLQRDGGERSVVIELLERADCSNLECATFHFHEIATGNEAEVNAPSSPAAVPAGALHPTLRDTPCFRAHGIQIMQHKDSQAATRLHVNVIVLRLESHATDMLVSLSRPCSILDDGVPPAEAQLSDREDDELLTKLVASLEVRDWALFGQ